MKTDSHTGALRPLGHTWRSDRTRSVPTAPEARIWTHRKLRLAVMSSLLDAKAPDGSGDVIPQWHLSLTRTPGPKRPTAGDLTIMVADFGLAEFEIDNHHPGNALHLWIPRDPARRVDCECKADEHVVVEPDGYTWTTPVDGPCRGCSIAPALGRPCSLHGRPAPAHP